ncbi:MAG: UDP-N-acetylglucosamine 2-epimerase (non-hydrolyzing) [Candidatus Moranbacteria bacterium]|nr:UDP-N-acetylglucosamine 2-epimerase (non-hydrolyzing) [Candidatus Moranbacteria bacterium]
MKKKVMVIVGTRPEIIRLALTIQKMENFFEVVFVHTGQNYDYNLNEVFFKDFDLRKPDYYLETPGENLGQTMGNVIAKSYEVMLKEKPDALLILGDTNSGLAAISAKRLKIPIFHMEAGNRCFDFNVPEEINRKIIDHVSDVNLAYTENARRYLVAEGMKNDFVYVTGSPMTEVLHAYKEKIEQSNVLEKLDITEKKYFVVSSHREENLDVGNNFEILANSLNAVAEKYQMPIIFSTHPRTAKKIAEKNIKFNDLIRNVEPLGFFDYVKLQKDAYCVLSDSGTISEESAILNFPAVSIRTSQERPEALDAGSIVLGGIDADNMLSAIEIAVKTHSAERKNLVKDYQDNNVSEKVIKIIQSYTNIVNTRTWGKKAS